MRGVGVLFGEVLVLVYKYIVISVMVLKVKML